MLSFTKARRRHLVLREALEGAPDETMAVSIWNGVTGIGGGDLISQAVADTTPLALSTILSTDDVAAACATATLFKAFGACPIPEDPPAARDIAELGWEHLLETIKERRVAGAGGGHDHSFAWVTAVTPEDVKLNQQKLRRIGRLAARMFRTLKGVKAHRVPNVAEEIAGVTLGSDFHALLPHEYALWRAGGVLRAELALRLSEGRAVQYAKEGISRRHRGALLILIDESGSMGGVRDDWSKAALTALTWMAWRSRRPVKIVHFSTATRVATLRPGSHRLLERAQLCFLDGGTSIPLAFNVGRREMADWHRQGVNDADIVLISDGDCHGVEDEAALSVELEHIRRSCYRLFGVAIETQFPELLQRACADCVTITKDDLDSDHKIPGVAGAI